MKNIVKIILVILTLFLLLIFVDSLQAKMFNNSPIIHKREHYQEYNSIKYIDKGILVIHYQYNDGKRNTYFNWEPLPF